MEYSAMPATANMVRYRTAAPLQMIEDWLELNCYRGWDLSINGLSEDLRIKEVLITFTSDRDKERFKEAVVSQRFHTIYS